MTTNDAAPRARLTARSIGTGAGLIGAALAPAASAATFTVTNLNDAGAGSLRQALTDANGAAGADTIDFTPGLTGTITLTTGQLDVSDSVTLTGPGATSLSVSGNNASRVFNTYNGTSVLDVTISGLTITGGNAVEGAGIRNNDENLTLDSVVISGNAAAGDGGGLWADGFNMNLTVRNSIISGNTAGDDGGGVYVEDTGGPALFENTRITGNNAAGKGGGAYLYDPDDDFTFDRCTISGNTAGNLGGGVYLYSPDSGVVRIQNSTVSGNTATAGGGLFLYSPDHGLLVENVTVSGNTATAGDGGGVYLYNLYSPTGIRHSTIVNNSASGSAGGVFSLRNVLPLDGVLIANNTAPTDADIANGAGGFAARFSLIEVPGAATITDNGGNVLNQDPQLGSLQDNGGPTFTHLPAAGSPALNAGDPAFAAPPAADQRGRSRVADGRIDIGAVEIQRSLFTLDAATYSVAENVTPLAVTVSRTPASGPASITLATSDGSATAGADYTAVNQTISFADGQASQVVNIAVLDDALAEGSETFSIALSAPSAEAGLGTTPNATATITDVEGGSFAFSSATYSVNEDAGTLTVTVTRSAGSTTAATIDYATSNGGASAGSDYTTSSGTLNFAAGQTSATFSVPILDDSLIEGNETFTVALSNPTGGATLAAVSSATATIADVEGGSFSLSAGTYGTTETAGSLAITVNRSAGNTTAATVQYATSNGSATAGADYTATSGTLSFAAGQTSANVSVPILDDAAIEGAETFDFSLSNPTGGATLGAPSIATATIADAESGSFSLDSATYNIGENGGSLAVTVNRTAGTTSAASVSYATSNGSASAGSDFTATTGTLNFAAGQTSASFSVPILEDALVEGGESFGIALSAPTAGAALGSPSTATATITDNDLGGTLGFAVTSITAQENAGTVVIQVTRTGGSDGAVSLDFATANGSATAPADFTATSGTLNWPAGDSSARTITIPLVDDTLAENAESFTVVLSNPGGGATLGSGVITVTIPGNDQAVPPAVIPTLGDIGRLLLAALMALLAWVGLRRRDAGTLLAVLALGGLLPAAADAEERTRERAPAHFEIATVAATGKQLVLRTADGSTRAIDPAALEIRLPRGADRQAADAKVLKTGQIVLLRTDGHNEGKQRAWLFPSLTDAEAMLARKRERRGH